MKSQVVIIQDGIGRRSMPVQMRGQHVPLQAAPARWSPGTVHVVDAIERGAVQVPGLDTPAGSQGAVDAPRHARSRPHRNAVTRGQGRA